MGIRVKGLIDPKVVIYDLGNVSVFKNQVIELTPTQFNNSADVTAMVAGNLLQVVLDPVTPPQVDPSMSDVDRQSFNIRNGVIMLKHLSDLLVFTLQGQDYYWAEDPKFNDDTPDVVSFGNGKLVFGNIIYALTGSSIGPATGDSYVVAILNPTLNTVTLKMSAIPYTLLDNEVIVASYDFTNKEIYVPKGISEQAENVSFDPAGLMFSAINVQGLGNELNGLLQGTVNPAMFMMKTSGLAHLSLNNTGIQLDANSGLGWSPWANSVMVLANTGGSIAMGFNNGSGGLTQVLYANGNSVELQSKGDITLRGGQYAPGTGNVRITNGSNGGDLRIEGYSTGQTLVERASCGLMSISSTAFSGAPGIRIGGYGNDIYVAPGQIVIAPDSPGDTLDLGLTGQEYEEIRLKVIDGVTGYRSSFSMEGAGIDLRTEGGGDVILINTEATASLTISTQISNINILAGTSASCFVGGFEKGMTFGQLMVEIDSNNTIVRIPDGTMQIPYDGALIGQGPTTDAIALKYNFTATVAPGVNDDDAQGYMKGSRWYQDDGMGVQEEFVCLSAATGAAVWKQTT